MIIHEDYVKYMSKNKNNIIVLSLLFLEVILIGCTSSESQRPQQVDVAKRIEEKCKTKKSENSGSTNSGCTIKLSDLFDFYWDQMYVFDLAVEDNVISNEIGSAFSSTSPYNSTKWFFLKDGKVVHFEEKLIKEIDKPIEIGGVEFEIKDAERKFAVYDRNAIFEVVELGVGDGKFKYLKCVTCN